MGNKIGLKKVKPRPKIDLILPKEDVINVEQFMALRGTEIKMMELAVQQSEKLKVRLPEQKLPHHLRRRANSYNEKKKKYPNKIRNFTNRKENENSKWLETHIWHAKRMRMHNLFGYKIALKPSLKCHKAIIKASKHGCCMNDKSYHSVFTIETDIQLFQSRHLRQCHTKNTNVQFLVNKQQELLGEVNCIFRDDILLITVHPAMEIGFKELLEGFKFTHHSDLGVFDLFGRQATWFARSVLKPKTVTNFTDFVTFPSCLNNQYYNFEVADLNEQFPPKRLPTEDFNTFTTPASDESINLSHITVLNTSWHQMNRLTILVPKKQIKLLWRSFIFCGVYACGLENVHSIYFEHQLPCYPFDHVNTTGYTAIHDELSTNAIEIWNKKAPIHKTEKPEFSTFPGTICTALNRLEAAFNTLYWCFITIQKGVAKYHDKIYFEGAVAGFVTTTQFHQTLGTVGCIGVVDKVIDAVEVHVGSETSFSIGQLELIE